MEFSTKALHVNPNEPYGAMRFPIYQTAAFETQNAQSLEEIFTGQKAGHAYSRSSNPTISAYEERVKYLSGAYGVISMASGMGAISNALFGLLKSGDNFIATKHLFGNTISLFDTLVQDLGIEVRYVQNLKEIKSHIDAKTKLFFCETLSNPQLSMIDLKSLKKILQEYNIPLVADTTMTPWNIFDAKANGIDIEVLSATKWLSGGGHVIGGLVLDYGTFDWEHAHNLDNFYAKYGKNAFISKLKKETFRNLGACLNAQSAYLLSLGLETLELRVQRSCDSALTIAKTLEKKGVNVHYPFLESSPYYEICKLTLTHGGAIMSLDLQTKEAAYKFMDKLRIFKRGTNILDNKSLAIAPYHTIYAEFSPTKKASWGVGEGLIRLSIGLEAPEDLIADILEAI
jgi:O-acetylhomoserine (thiol)-lyase